MPECFDTAAFFSALDAVRRSRELTWKDVASESGVAASTLSRIGQGKKPDVNGLAALLAWSNLKAEMFIPNNTKGRIDPVAQIASIIRMDKSLSTNSAKVMEEIVTNTYRQLRDLSKKG